MASTLAAGTRCGLMKRGLSQCYKHREKTYFNIKPLLNAIKKHEKRGIIERIRDMDSPIEPDNKPLCAARR